MKCTKKGFATEQIAQAFISKAWAGNGSWKGSRLPTRSYSCRYCNQYHVTSAPLLSPQEQYQYRQMA